MIARLDLEGSEDGGSRPAHHHVAQLEDGLAFVNTRRLVQGIERELLPDLNAALAWLRGHELMHDDALRVLVAREQRAPADATGRDLQRVRQVREALHELVEASAARRPPDEAALATVNQTLRSPARYELVLEPDGITMGHRHEGDPLDAALALLAETIARGVSQGDPGRIRICANPACRVAFVDRSRGGRRKWCDMATCGNRAKAARHRARHREPRAAVDVARVNTTAPGSSTMPRAQAGAARSLVVTAHIERTAG